MARKHNKGIPLKKGNFSIYILVDGECEQDYLNSIRNEEPYKEIISSQRIKIAPDIPKTKSLEAQFENVSEALNHYDKVLWIVDYDVIRQQSAQQKTGTSKSFEKFLVLSSKFKKLLELKKHSGKEAFVLINNPSIEFWYLLHFEKTSKLYLTSDSVERKLAGHFKEYTKKDEKFRKSIFKLLKDNLPDAINHAQAIEENDNDIQARADIYKIFLNDLELLRPTPEK